MNGIPVEKYDKNGQLIGKTTGGMEHFMSELDQFSIVESADNDYARYGYYYVQ